VRRVPARSAARGRRRRRRRLERGQELTLGVVAELWRYPVKSFLGERLDEVELDARGVVGDRAFAVRDANGKFGSGKTTRRFRLLRGLFDFAAATCDGDVEVRAPDGSVFRVGDPALAALLSDRYSEPLAVLPEETVPHFDAGAVHLLTTSSLELMGDAGDTRRYRPNIVVETNASEDEWIGSTIAVGSSTLRVSATVERCAMVGFAQQELPADPRILRFLVETRNTMLGVYADVVEPATIRVGDPVVAKA
jgi:uncharacterized protein